MFFFDIFGRKSGKSKISKKKITKKIVKNPKKYAKNAGKYGEFEFAGIFRFPLKAVKH